MDNRQVADAGAAVLALWTPTPDVLISDVGMGHVNGVKAAAHARRNHPDLRVILISRDVPAQLITAAGLAGAEAVIEKADVRHQLARVLLDHDPTPTSQPPGGSFAGLSVRERQIADRAAHGRSNAQIAAELGLSVNSVKTNISRPYSKLGLTNRVQLARLLDTPLPPPAAPESSQR